MPKKKTAPDRPQPLALAALRRAAKIALKLAIQTNTPCWIMVDGKMVDATKLPRKKPRKKASKKTDSK
jgi:hypothetical protein